MKVNTTKYVNSPEELIEENAVIKKFMDEFEKRTVTLPLIDGQDDVLECCINGYNILLKRGEAIDLPENVIELLRNANVL